MGIRAEGRNRRVGTWQEIREDINKGNEVPRDPTMDSEEERIKESPTRC